LAAALNLAIAGTIEGRAGRIDHDSSKQTTAAAPAGGDTPTVATTEEVEIEARRLTVRDVRPVAGTCNLTP
jgi:hypothetical protein